MATILITGGSGLIGTALTKALLVEGHVVRHLGRSKRALPGVNAFTWDVPAGRMEGEALDGVDHIVHLAGAGIADERWSKARVRELIDSRTETIRLLLRVATERGVTPRSLVSAAGINFYGSVTSDHVYTESDLPGTDTIAEISREWEAAVDEWKPFCRVVKLRTAVVLAREGGALPKLAQPARLGLGAALGTGRQWMPWIHLDDLVRIYQQAITDEQMHGAYNASTGSDVTNADLMHAVARALGKPFFLPPVPGFMLRLALGEMSSILLGGSRASNARMLSTGFRFVHPDLEPALAELLGGRRA